MKTKSDAVETRTRCAWAGTDWVVIQPTRGKHHREIFRPSRCGQKCASSFGADLEQTAYAFDSTTATFKPVLGIEVAPTVAKGTSLSAIEPERLIAAVGKKPAF